MYKVIEVSQGLGIQYWQVVTFGDDGGSWPPQVCYPTKEAAEAAKAKYERQDAEHRGRGLGATG